MKPDPKIFVCLLLFVATIYVARHDNFSPTSGALRILAATRPTSALCDGVSFSETFSDSEKKQAASLKSALSKIRGGNKLQNILTGKADTDTIIKDYLPSLLAAAGVWIFMFIVSILACICQCCNWCCMYGCCKGCCRACRCCKTPKTSARTKCYIFVTGFFLLGIFSVTIAGMVIAAKLHKGYTASFCSVYNLIEDLVYGRSADSWMGLSGVVDNLDTLNNNIQSTINGLAKSTNTGTLQTQADAAITAIDTDICSHSPQSFTATKPDPNDNSATYAPDFTAILCPKSTSGNYAYLLSADVTYKRTVAETANTVVNNAVDDVIAQRSSIESGILSGKNAASSALDSVKGTSDDLAKFGDNSDKIFARVAQGIQAVFGALFGINALTMLSIAAIVFFKWKVFNKYLHFSWCLILLLAILGFVVSAIIFPLSIVIMEACDVLQQSLNSASYFNSTIYNFASQKGSSESVDTLYNCMFGTGDAIGQFGVTDKLADFNDMFTQFTIVDGLKASDGTSNPPAYPLLSQKFNVSQIANFQQSDSTIINTAIDTLNKKTLKSQNSCATVSDTWILSSVNCTSSMGSKYDSSKSDTYDHPSATCVGFDAWTKDGSSRYPSSEFSSCGSSVQSYVQDFVTNFKNNRAAIQTEFTTIGTYYTTYATSESTFASALKTWISNIDVVENKLASIRDQLVGSDNGLLKNTKCSFIKTSLSDFSNSLCSGFIVTIYQSAILIIITSVFSFFAAICIFCTAKRINVKEKKDDKYEVPAKQM